ncbi:hypothetical protein U1Q18_012609, partial [Sarracenia purpurea var. burkii]
ALLDGCRSTLSFIKGKTVLSNDPKSTNTIGLTLLSFSALIAHGEDNENFQLQSYFMLDEESENIVLVHYREVKEGSKLGGLPLHTADPGSQLRSSQISSSPCLEQTSSLVSTVQTPHASSSNVVGWNEQTFCSKFEDEDFGEDPGTPSLAQAIHGSVSHGAFVLANEATGFLELLRGHLDLGFLIFGFGHGIFSFIWGGIGGSSGDLNSTHEQKCYFKRLSADDFLTHNLTDADWFLTQYKMWQVVDMG